MATRSATVKSKQLATLFDPITKARRVVEVGSQEAQQYFGRGWKLQTATQNPDTWSQTPQREILQGQGPQLLARDNVAGTSTPVSDPRALSEMVNTGGYQDSRRSLNLAPNDVSLATTGPTPSGTTGGANSASGVGAPATSGATFNAATTGTATSFGGQTADPTANWNKAIADLLKSAQTGSMDEDLLKQRNALVNARFNAIGDPTPEELRVLSPGQQDSIRNMEASGLSDQLGGVNSALDSRERARTQNLNSAISIINMANSVAQENRIAGNALRDDARNSIQFMYNTFGSEWAAKLTDEERRNIERSAELPGGFLDVSGQTLKEEGAVGIATSGGSKTGAKTGQVKYIPATRTQPAGYVDQSTGLFYTVAEWNAKQASGSEGGSLQGSFQPSGKPAPALSAEQQASIQRLMQKPQDQWTDADKKNYAYATGQVYAPQGTAPAVRTQVSGGTRITSKTTAKTPPRFTATSGLSQVRNLMNKGVLNSMEIAKQLSASTGRTWTVNEVQGLMSQIVNGKAEPPQGSVPIVSGGGLKKTYTKTELTKLERAGISDDPSAVIFLNTPTAFQQSWTANPSYGPINAQLVRDRYLSWLAEKEQPKKKEGSEWGVVAPAYGGKTAEEYFVSLGVDQATIDEAKKFGITPKELLE
ncbi:hypothetical protein A2635_05315 [Candidatus Peribacteria bacterium RIFCSPHIGHO2_01_FULL_51_9]|nr:MAG: hypothetical protein A2635_05315 [Candidatus Peribacteria bacterium RIFCSPHIGHO2_01_FULL_51_9]